MTSFLSSLFGKSTQAGAGTAKKKVALITNFSACPLGLQLLNRLSESNSGVVAVSHDASRFESKVDKERVSLFEAFPNEEQDRNRIVSYLIANDMQVATLVQNQPFMLKPTVDEPQSDSDIKKDFDPAKL